MKETTGIKDKEIANIEIIGDHIMIIGMAIEDMITEDKEDIMIEALMKDDKVIADMKIEATIIEDKEDMKDNMMIEEMNNETIMEVTCLMTKRRNM